MKPTKYILILLSLFLISNCGEKVREEITDRYDDGKKKVLVGYKGKGSDEEIVKRIEYYKNGEISLEGNYKDGEKDRKWTLYYSNGQKWREENYKASS